MKPSVKAFGRQKAVRPESSARGNMEPLFCFGKKGKMGFIVARNGMLRPYGEPTSDVRLTKERISLGRLEAVA
jgi:hypothetical protein